MAKALPLESIPVYGASKPPKPGIDFSTGAIVLVNKPQNWTSFDAVKYLRGRLATRKVGHAGTLDPMATGLLVLCTGKATKSISQIQGLAKTYTAEITFGASTPTYDADSAPDQTAAYEHITLAMISEKFAGEYSGDIMQVPPMFSALKRNGKKLYELARRGKTVELEARPVHLYETEILSFELPKLEVKITCSKGTYIRSIAHDLGLALNSRAHLSKLERTAIGTFTNNDALSPQQYNKLLRPNV